MKKLLVLCPYPEGVAPSQRLKFEQYYEFFREMGYAVTVCPFMDHGLWVIAYSKGKTLWKVLLTLRCYLRRLFDLLRVPFYDTTYVHLWVTPFGPAFFERVVRWLSRRMIYDIDDLIYLKEQQTSSKNRIAGLLKSASKPLYLMRVADHVITCTPYLDEFVRRWNCNTTDISSTINTDVYLPKIDYRIGGRFVIGWSGSHSTSRMLHLLDDVFIELARQCDFKLIVMGAEDFTLPGVECEVVPWAAEHEVAVLKRFDIGVYPLPDEEWVLGKSGLKALQYMALGIPTVATGIGTIFRIITDGENGFLASSKEEWKLALRELMTDQSLRERIGRSAAATVRERYSVSSTRDTYAAILSEVARER